MNHVIRLGNTVRRRVGPHSPAVHELLVHLRATAFVNAPEFLGIDTEDREILSFFDCVLGQEADPGMRWSDETLAAAGQMLRRFHDAQTGLSIRSMRRGTP